MSQDTSSEQPPLPSKQRKSFFHHAATASVWLIAPPFVIQFLTATIFYDMQRDLVHIVVRLASAFLIMGSMGFGVVLGVIALCGIPKYGQKGILVKALFGILVPVLLILVSLPAAMKAAAIASKIKAQQEAP